MNSNKYLFYNGKYYDVGTKVKMKTKYDGIVTTTFNGYGEYEGQNKYSFASLMPPEHYIVEIVDPVELPNDENDAIAESEEKFNSRQGDIQIGWIWYIIVMLLGSIFNDRLLIWGMATAIFFIWNGGKHFRKKGGKK